MCSTKINYDIMCTIEQFEELLNVELPQPSSIETISTVWSNGRFSVLQKRDGSFSIWIESTQTEQGHFLTQQEAEDFIKQEP